MWRQSNDVDHILRSLSELSQSMMVLVLFGGQERSLESFWCLEIDLRSSELIGRIRSIVMAAVIHFVQRLIRGILKSEALA